MDFGPKLDEYLSSCQGRTSWGCPPSKAEIRRAIASLVDPYSVSYKTFETIMALERTPSCAYASLLVSGAHILPSCIRLLRHYCKSNDLFDHAYGYLCLQVMNLSIEVAKLIQVNELKPFLQLVDLSLGGDPDEVITEGLSAHIRKLESDEFGPEHEYLHPANKLLAWRADPSTGLITALPQVGGFTILDMEFLTDIIWMPRNKFLRTLRSALPLLNFAGWCGIFHLMHNTLVRVHGMPPAKGQEYDHDESWVILLDVIHRYALCASRHEDSTVAHLLNDRPKHDRMMYKMTVLDTTDLDQIVAAYLDKVEQCPTILDAYVTRLFTFTISNCYLDESKFVSNVTRITEATLEQSWNEFFLVDDLGLLGWRHFVDTVMNNLILVPACGGLEHKQATAVKIITNENLLDFLGYFVLYPLSAADKTFIEKRWFWEPFVVEVLEKFIPLLKECMSSAPVELVDRLYSSWSKPLQSLKYHKTMKGNNSKYVRDYIQTWEIGWQKIGEAIDSHRVRNPSQCGNPRCPTLQTTTELQCAGCFGQIYCSRRCHHAHWVHSYSPHQLECGKQLEVVHRAGRS